MSQRQTWTYMLRIPGGNPGKIRMDRLGEYLQQFALILGVENKPVFTGVKNASIGVRAKVPNRRRQATWKRLQEGKYKPDTRVAGSFRKLESMLAEDSFDSAEIKDFSGNVVALFEARKEFSQLRVTIKKSGEVDGVVTGLVGADDTMHLHLRDIHSRDIKLIVRDESMARSLLANFRKGSVRVTAHGNWIRTEDGWVPENNKCTVDAFIPLSDDPLSLVFERFSSIPGNGWVEMGDPYSFWNDIRGGE